VLLAMLVNNEGGFVVGRGLLQESKRQTQAMCVCVINSLTKPIRSLIARVLARKR
jgi:hypothetical protein